MKNHQQAQGPSDRMHLDVDDEQAVIELAKSFCVTPRDLLEAVETTGTDIEVLEEHFRSE